jgi:murein DD-endopeptidase MepM/ murein hydrolase activator NlpD
VNATYGSNPPGSPARNLRPARQFGKRLQPATITIERNGKLRQFAISPLTLSVLGCALAMFFIGYFAATAYLIFREDLVAALRHRDIAMRERYEDRIAALRTELDRAVSRQLLDQQVIENRLSELLKRQQLLDGNGGSAGKLAKDAQSRGVLVPAPAIEGSAETDSGSNRKNSPQASLGSAGQGFRLTIASLAGGVRESAQGLARQFARSGAGNVAGGDSAELNRSFSSIAERLGEIDSHQRQWVAQLRQAAEIRIEKLEVAVNSLSPSPDAASGTSGRGIGGPFVPNDARAAFEQHVAALDHAFRRIDALAARIDRIPLSAPLAGARITSDFGERADPFFGTSAMHSGIDFAAGSGTPVPAVAAGTVVEASYAGGYGNMVEIDHGNGLSTRYGHLSAIKVKVGDNVTRGQVVAESGSTGRSTGPHLHYEVRRNGIAVDPEGFIRAGRELGVRL